MENKILDGKAASNYIISDINREVNQHISESHDRLGYTIEKPKMAVVLVGNSGPSETYVKNKIKACERAGIESKLIRFPETITAFDLYSEIMRLNQSSFDGFIVQLPLPSHIDPLPIINAIDPKKDIDGFSPLNFGKMALGQASLRPATPYGILKLMQHYKVETKGKHVVVVGRSNLVGKPLAIMLGNDFKIGRATVTSCDINTPRELLLDELSRADIVIVAVGKPGLITADMVKEGVVVIDVGINRLDDGRLVGDVDFDGVYEKASLITPVPGGVGPMTIAALMVNTLNAWKVKNLISEGNQSRPDLESKYFQL
jgi:methylenetetrahydrofolate dehydrogenase (NADP+)/methenyltetrahydrofolate cyclohydrolase